MGSDPAGRIVSMDQFRGYTVAGMILVNYLGDFSLSHPVLSHHNVYFSYADSIMPAFHFAVGFAFRLSLLRLLQRDSRPRAYWRFIRRNLGLILLSLVLSAIDHRFKHWTDLCATGVWGALAGPLKCEFWETLAIIGVTSLWVLPVMAARPAVRIVFLLACAAAHVVLSHHFYFDFLWARPNALDGFWGAADVRGLDGGPFGFLAWAIPQLVGSLAYDAVTTGRRDRGALPLAAWAGILMAVGYGLSCLTLQFPGADRVREAPGSSPVVPPGVRVPETGWTGLFVEPPFVAPPEGRPLTYWTMSKRAGTLSFMLFASGFSLAVYAFFVLACDLGPLRVGVFRTFGQNPLAAYIIHGLVGNAVGAFAPPDSPGWWVALSFGVYAGITYLFVHHLEKNRIYLRM